MEGALGVVEVAGEEFDVGRWVEEGLRGGLVEGGFVLGTPEVFGTFG